MAKVYNNGGDLLQPVVMEDPRTGNDGFWIFGRRHDKDTLTPQYNKVMNWAVENDGFDGLDNNNRMYQSTVYAGQNQLLLSKMTVHCGEYYNDTASYYNCPDDAAWRYMDSTTEDSQNFTTWTEHDNGSGTKRMALWNSYGSSSSSSCAVTMYGYNTALTSSQNLDEVRVSENGEYLYDRMALSHPDWVDSANGYIYAMAEVTSTSSSNSSWYGPSYGWLYAGTGWPSSYDSTNNTTSISGNLGVVQVLGKSTVDSKYITVSMSKNSNNTGNIKITKHTFNGTSVTGTELADLQTGTPSAAGSHSGGYNLNGDSFWCTCSKTFTDPRDSNKKAFYRSYWDTNGDFHPFVVTWDTTDDSFLIETDITITGDESSTHANLLTVTFDTSFCSDALLTETWATSSDRYVGYIPIDNKGTDTNAAKRTVIVYTMNSSDPTALTYHSKITFAEVARNIVWLNDARTLMGVFFKTSFRIYSFGDSAGWAETTNIGSEVTACGRDADDRIWYVRDDPELGDSVPALYLLTPTLPVSITVTPELSSYTYSGSNITSYVDVSALNESGTRIAASVKLVIEGSSMTFTDGTTTKTVTTLTSGELQVGTTITNSGFTNVTASVVV